MSGRDPTLQQIQRWMQSVLMHPGGVAEAMTSPQACEQIDLGPEDLERVIVRSRALTSEARLEIYVDAYYERLLECLREEFVATRFAVGGELFDALAFGYLQQCPSQSYTLNALGERFPGYLAETRLHTRAIPSEAPPGWEEFVIELATYERLLRDVFDSPGTEHRIPIDAESLASIAARQWNSLRLVVAPCLRLHRFDHTVHRYWLAVRDLDAPRTARQQPTYLAISRRDYVVERFELEELEFALLSRLLTGVSLGEAIGGLITPAGGGHQDLEGKLSYWFGRWTAAGFFVAFTVDSGPR